MVLVLNWDLRKYVGHIHGFSLKSGFTKILCTPNIPLAYTKHLGGLQPPRRILFFRVCEGCAKRSKTTSYRRLIYGFVGLLPCFLYRPPITRER